MNRVNIKKYTAYLFSLAVIVTVWKLVSLIINSQLILPSPEQVIKEVFHLAASELFWTNFLLTAIRCFIGFIISILLGLILGILCGKWDFFRYFLELPLSIFRTTPVIAIILISLYWLNSNTLPVLISVLMCLPIIVTAVTQGFETVNVKLMDMAGIYNFSAFQKLINIQLPACFNNYKTACISSFGLCWKVVVAGEVLCLPKKGLGSIMQNSQIHLETASVIAITILLVLFSWLLEKLIQKVVFAVWKK